MWHYLIFQSGMLLSALVCHSYNECQLIYLHVILIYITNLHVVTCMSYMSYMVYI